MPLQGVLRKPKGQGLGLYLADQIRARRALVRWLRQLADGRDVSLAHAAKEAGMSVQRLRRVLKKDEELREKVFGPLTEDARLGLLAAAQRGLRLVQDQDADPKEVRLWGEFFARLGGGMFTRPKQERPLLVLQQLIPNLPPAAHAVQAKVLETSPADESLETLLEEATDG